MPLGVSVNSTLMELKYENPFYAVALVIHTVNRTLMELK